MQISVTICDFCQNKKEDAYSFTIHDKKIDMCLTCADSLEKAIREVKWKDFTSFGNVVSPNKISQNVIDYLELNKYKYYTCKECKDTISIIVPDYENSLDHITKKLIKCTKCDDKNEQS